MKSPVPVVCFLLAAGLSLSARGAASTFVDENGVMRWTDSRAEVVQFGVNYTAPFAHAFRALGRMGIPVEKAIDADVYHFARMGLDAYRVHVWDREISDPVGNLVVNDHVHALDYLLAKLKERGIKIILTPLQFGNAAYPEGGLPLDGFSGKYGKRGCLEDRESWPLQERYLQQFLDHVNPLTGLAYKNDPDILAFEICNEPGHFEYALTLEYINRMVGAMRSTGCEKPVFYNMSHGIPVHEAYLDANVQGGTFQWYPSNLVANHEQWGNFLPYVDDYPIPFAAEPKFRSKAKMAYEFDSADIGRSYLYPAMARSFRKAGMQFATQFAYDGLHLAPVNTEYQTHYLNLAYAPQKALGMKIAGEAFRRVPRFKAYGEYPGNVRFAGVRVSYEEDLAELVTDEKFFHTNETASRPPAPERLLHVAGYGSSSIVDYPGQGAYFLDRLEAGVWRLEVMPDAIWVRDPFEKPNPEKQVSRISWNEWAMRISLPDLGADFTAAGLNDGNGFADRAVGGALKIRPGAYLLTRQGVTTKFSRNDKWENIVLKEFVAPAASLDRTCVLHQPAVEATAGTDLRVSATIAAPGRIDFAEVVAFPPVPLPADDDTVQPRRNQPGKGNAPGAGATDDSGAKRFPMTRTAGFQFTAEIPGSQLSPGTLRYHVVVHGADGNMTFPSGLRPSPVDWDFYGESWRTRIVTAGAPILLFDAATDAAKITADHRDVKYEIVPSDRPGTGAMAMIARHLELGEHDHSFRFYFKEKVKGRAPELGGKSRLVLFGRSTTAQSCPVQVAVVSADGIAYGGMVSVPPGHAPCAIAVSALHQVRAPNIPHGYPVFLNYWSEIHTPVPLDLARAESVLVSIGPTIAPGELPGEHGVEIERIWLE